MPQESASFITQLNPSWPLLSDTVYSLQGQLVCLKQVLQTQFPNLGAAPVTGTAAALNIASSAFSGATMTVPASTTLSASLILSAAPGATAVALMSGTGLSVVSQGPTVASVTPPAIIEMRTDGLGDVYVLTSLNAPLVSATTLAATSIMKNGAELLPHGVIVWWSGSAVSIPAGYVLCNGANGTPNLVDKFIVGAGNLYAPGATGGTTTAALSVANIPAHTHSLTDPGHNHVIVDPGHNHVVIDPSHTHVLTDPGHSHTVPGYIASGNGTFAFAFLNGSGTVSNYYSANSTNTGSTGITMAAHSTGITNTANTTGITNTGTTTGITMGSIGSGTAFGILPPYYALCAIMKL